MRALFALPLALIGACDSGGTGIGETCQEYLDCLSTAGPDDYQTQLTLYGEESSCWSDDETSDACEDICADELDDLPSSCEDQSTATHPLIPDEYAYLWDTDGCTTQGGNSGAMVYKLAQGESTDGETLSMTEEWYWLFGGDWDEDCKDTWEIELEWLSYDYSQLDCSGCDEGWRGTWTLVESTCGISYESLFDFDDAPDGDEYEVIYMFDTVTPSGTLNVDNAMLVVALHTTEDESGWAFSSEWARGHAYPTHTDTGEDGLITGPPGEYDWVGDDCIGVSR